MSQDVLIAKDIASFLATNFTAAKTEFTFELEYDLKGLNGTHIRIAPGSLEHSLIARSKWQDNAFITISMLRRKPNEGIPNDKDIEEWLTFVDGVVAAIKPNRFANHKITSLTSPGRFDRTKWKTESLLSTVYVVGFSLI